MHTLSPSLSLHNIFKNVVSWCRAVQYKQDGHTGTTMCALKRQGTERQFLDKALALVHTEHITKHESSSTGLVVQYSLKNLWDDVQTAMMMCQLLYECPKIFKYQFNTQHTGTRMHEHCRSAKHRPTKAAEWNSFTSYEQSLVLQMQLTCSIRSIALMWTDRRITTTVHERDCPIPLLQVLAVVETHQILQFNVIPRNEH